MVVQLTITMGAHRQMLWLTPVVAGTEISSTVYFLAISARLGRGLLGRQKYTQKQCWLRMLAKDAGNMQTFGAAD